MSESTPGYFRFPTIYGDRIVFVSEDDLWEVSDEGGLARRITSGRGHAGYANFSPDGRYVAYTASEEGYAEVYVVDVDSGLVKKLTHLAAFTTVVGWSADGTHVIFRSNYKQDLFRQMTLYKVHRDGGEPEDFKLGEGQWYHASEDGKVKLLGRFADDIARWKRYKGGTAGVVWIKEGRKNWSRLLPDIQSGVVRPIALGDRIYFISDFEGYGELYSCDHAGEDIQKHTNHRGFYVRFANTDGARITYSCGGDIYIFDPESNTSEKVEIDYRSPRTQLARKFPSARRYLTDLALHPKGHAMALISRGKLFALSNFDGGVFQLGDTVGVRHRNVDFLNDGKRLVYLSDESGEEQLKIRNADGSGEEKLVKVKGDFGRLLYLAVSPTDDAIAGVNQRYELVHINLKTGKLRVVDTGRYDRIQGFDWAPDGRWIAYSCSESMHTNTIKIVNTKSWKSQTVTSGQFQDVDPVFDPKGRYLYFISQRYFEPVYDSLFFGIGFPESAKPCVVTLRDDVDSPFLDTPTDFEIKDDDDGEEKSASTKSKKASKSKSKKSTKGKKKSTKKKDDEEIKVEIDFEGISDRVQAFPVPVGSYYSLGATEKKVFWVSWENEAHDPEKNSGGPSGEIETFSLEDRKRKHFASANGYQLSRDTEKIAIYGRKIRIVASSDAPSDDSERPGKNTGYIDLDRVTVRVEPQEEWRQMLREAWRLMRDHFWKDTMSGHDWDAIWERYATLLDRLNCRSEFSDLVWTMQGELGTSHAYEFGGDYRKPPVYAPAFLGADLTWDTRRKALKVERIVTGDAWDKREGSPLSRAGVNVVEGDLIETVNGRAIDKNTSLEELLTNKAGKQVTLGVKRGRKRHSTIVTPIRSETGVRYRQWIADNRRKVHEASKGRVGYIHVPDMSAQGYAEFHRGFLAELQRDALIVDVRYNGGGHVSQLLLEKLSRKRIGYDIPRYGDPVPYPSDSLIGPMVALTNEKAGSDGDIFSHCFKLMNLGPLIGKRTWGGVIGIWPRHMLVDHSITTQPEFSFWFQDVGYGVENYGTDPDIEVDISPDDYRKGIDPQLDEGIRTIKRLLAEQKPGLPDFGPEPNLAPPQPKKKRTRRKR